MEHPDLETAQVHLLDTVDEQTNRLSIIQAEFGTTPPRSTTSMDPQQTKNRRPRGTSSFCISYDHLDSSPPPLLNTKPQRSFCYYMLQLSRIMYKVRWRYFAIVLTIGLESVVAKQLDAFNDSSDARKWVLLSATLPTLSAVSGNIAIQSSSHSVREIGAREEREADHETFCTKFIENVVLAFMTGPVLGLVCMLFWVTDTSPMFVNSNTDIFEEAIIFGVIMSIIMFFCGIFAGCIGQVGPIFASMLGLDPAQFSGPMETALQDLAGYTFALHMGVFALNRWGPDRQGCPGGNLGNCVQMCIQQGNNDMMLNNNGSGTAGTAVYNMTCLDNCVGLAGLGAC